MSETNNSESFFSLSHLQVECRIILKVSNLFVVDLQHAHTQRILVLMLPLFHHSKHLIEGSKVHSSVVLRTFHRVCLSRSSLSICKYADIVTVHSASDKIYNIIEDILLRRFWNEHSF